MSEIVWAFINSPTGATIIGGIFAWLVARLFAWKPRWRKVYEEHKGTLIAAVRHAEKAIADDTENAAAKKADAALKFVLGVHSSLSRRDVEQALSVTHAEEEPRLEEKKKARKVS